MKLVAAARAMTALRALMTRMSTAMVILPLAAAPRLWAVAFDQGVFWPDEIYQSLEQAHRLAFGYGFVPWEFRDGARSWVFPGALAIVLKVTALLAGDHARILVRAAKLFMVALGLVGIYACMRFAKAIAGERAALLAGTACALFPAGIVYGARCMSEMASAPLLALAAWWVAEGEAVTGMRRRARDPSRWRPIAAGAVAALAIYLRYQNGLFAVGFLVWLAFTRRWRDALLYGVAAFVVGIAGGLLDWATWGRPFHSFLVYVKFNVIEGHSSEWGTAEFGYYARVLWTSTGWGLVPFVVGFVLAFARLRVVPLFLILMWLGHAMVPHKEYRFLMPIAPLGLATASIGLALGIDAIAARVGRARVGRVHDLASAFTTALAMSVGVAFVVHLRGITFGAMGQAIGDRDENVSPWHHEEGPNLAFWDAGEQPDLCGIAMSGTPIVSSGGYAYLHKNVPLVGYWSLSSVNYLAAPRMTPPPQGWRLVAGYPDYVLFKRDGACAPMPWFQQTL